jgi:hypothetical protein
MAYTTNSNDHTLWAFVDLTVSLSRGQNAISSTYCTRFRRTPPKTDNANSSEGNMIQNLQTTLMIRTSVNIGYPSIRTFPSSSSFHFPTCNFAPFK